MAYTNNPTGNPVDRIRLLVGDISTSTSAEYLSDVDYNWLNSETGNVYVAAQLAANSLAALFTGSASSATGSGYVEKTVGDLRLRKADATQMAQSYRLLAAKFGRMAASKIVPSAGGITISGKRTAEADSDRVSPYFQRGLLDNPEATSLTTNTHSETDEVV